MNRLLLALLLFLVVATGASFYVQQQQINDLSAQVLTLHKQIQQDRQALTVIAREGSKTRKTLNAVVTILNKLLEVLQAPASPEQPSSYTQS